MSRALPIAYSIDREGGLKLDIALVETDRLLLHEETIPDLLEALAERIRDDGVLKSPVIIDRGTMVVLDGMHRVKALRILGCRFTCACLVDYQNNGIKVDRWCRTISKSFNLEEAVKLTGELDLILAPKYVCTSSDSIDAVNVMKFRDASYEITSPRPGFMPAFDAVRELEFKLRISGFEVGYETERDADKKLASGAVDAVLCPPQIGKKQIIDTAKAGLVFTFKVTRHIIPARPVGVNVPLSLLRNHSLSVQETNERLSAILHRKKIRHAPPGGIWGRRRYDEDLYVFEES